jgi:hypothetical protein
MKTSNELIEWAYEIYVQMLIPDEFVQSWRNNKDCNDDDE